MRLTHYLKLGFQAECGLTSGLIFSRVIDHLRSRGDIRFALAFPEAREGESQGREGFQPSSLGNECQLFGSEDDLEKATVALRRFEDYVFIGRVRPVPASCRHAVYERARKSRRSPAAIEREIRRTLRRAEAGKVGAVSDEDLARLRKGTKKGVEPFLMAKSHSTGQIFALTFHRRTVDEPVPGDFDSYGFARQGASVPVV